MVRSSTRWQSWLAATLTLLMLAGTAGAVSAQGGDSELAKELPPVDLPSMNAQGFVFNLESSYSGTPSGTPTDAPVYAMKLQSLNGDQAKALADALGIGADLQDQGNGTFAANGNGKLFVTPGLAQYVAPGASPEGSLASDSDIIAAAREWLRSKGQLPGNIGDGTIETKVDNPAQAIVVFLPVSPTPLLSAIPSISVTVGASNTIVEASWRWADLSQADTYQLRPLDQAWTEVVERRSYVNATLPSDKFPDGSTIAGSAIYSSVSLAWAPSGVPGEQQYLQPVYVFTGKLTPKDSQETYAITAYVPALANSKQPVG
ncbi:MAG: hypothetical protein WBA46_12470 [Thermomicrobiales bacterium]